jgi:uncharacterized protein (DUF2336 family)
MLSIASLLSDVESSVGRSSGEDRARTLSRITDLLVRAGASFGPEQIELFDQVIQRFASAIETQARVELAERLARLAHAPHGVVVSLAHDQIAVARPVLAGSPRLDDQDLMRIALAKGRDHMLAIAERSRVSTLVTDVLVSWGDGLVRHAIVGNPGARFSPTGTATLVEHAREDDALGALLGERTDLSPFESRQLLDIAKDSARRRLLATLPGAEREIDAAVQRGATALRRLPARLVRSYAAAASTLDAVMRERQLTEQDLVGFAEDDRPEETISAVSAITGLSLGCIERIFEERENDLLIVIGKAQGWTWRTVRALLRLRDPSLTERHHFRRAEETFDGLASPTAARVLHFLKVRETASQAARSPASQTRTKVR